MPADLTTLPPGPRPPEVIYAIIEISKGERNKYEYDPELGVFRLDRVLYSAVHYPAAYGFIPSTQAADGDPVDILVLTTETTFTGCLIEARPVGIFRMRDRKGEDEKILAVPTVDPRYSGIVDLAGLPAHFLREVEHFFTIYKDLEGETVETFGWADRSQALEVIRQSIRTSSR